MDRSRKVHTCKQNAIEIKRKDEIVLDRLQVLSESVKVKVKQSKRPNARYVRYVRTETGRPAKT